MDANARYRWFAARVFPHEGTMRRWLAARRVSREDRDDLIQDLYERLWEAGLPDALGTVEDPRAFAFKALANVHRDQLRRARVVVMDHIANPDLLVNESEVGPERRVAVRQEYAKLESVVSRLPPKQQTVFVMRMLWGYSIQEIAKQNGVSERTVENQLREASARIGRELPELKSSQQQPSGRAGREQRRRRDERD